MAQGYSFSKVCVSFWEGKKAFLESSMRHLKSYLREIIENEIKLNEEKLDKN
jgi:hypothetical protein